MGNGISHPVVYVKAFLRNLHVEEVNDDGVEEIDVEEEDEKVAVDVEVPENEKVAVDMEVSEKVVEVAVTAVPPDYWEAERASSSRVLPKSFETEFDDVIVRNPTRGTLMPSSLQPLLPPPNLNILTSVPENPDGSTPWGIEVKPGHPYEYKPAQGKGCLRINKGCLSDGHTGHGTNLYCKVSPDGQPFIICGFPANTKEAVMNLYIEEDEEVIFTAFGPEPVFLSGYYMLIHPKFIQS